MADAVRSLTIVNEKPDLDALYTSKFNLHVAKSVKKGDEGESLFSDTSSSLATRD